MADPTLKYQQYVCPEEFQDRLTEIGGVNRYDEPNFIIVWGQGGEPNALYRAGGAWHAPDLPTFTGYRDLLIGGGTPSWSLLQWQDPVHYGTPEMYYIQNFDEETGLQTLGEYPYLGRYRLLYNLRWMEKVGNELRCEAMPLNAYLLESIVPIIMAAKEISWEKTKAVLKDIKDREDAADISLIEDAMRASSLPFKGNPVSYTKQGCRTALIDKKIESMTRCWNQIQSNAKSFKGKGLIQR